MQATTFWPRGVGPLESGDLADLRRELIVEISAAMVGVAWVVMVSALGFEGHVEQLWVALCLLGGAAASFWLRHVHFRAALCCLIGGLIGAIAAQQWLFPHSLAQFFFPVVVVLSSLLVSSVSVFVVATLTSLNTSCSASSTCSILFIPCCCRASADRPSSSS